MHQASITRVAVIEIYLSRKEKERTIKSNLEEFIIKRTVCEGEQMDMGTGQRWTQGRPAERIWRQLKVLTVTNIIK